MQSFRIFKTRAHIPKKSRIHILLDHILATILPLTGLSLSILLGPPIENTTLLIFIPLIALSAWVGGLSAGVLTTLISVVLLNYYGLILANEPSPFDFSYFFQSFLFALEGVFLSLLVDIVKHRERIGEYKKREKELNDKIIQLEEENQGYEKEIDTRNEFLSIASHELKTPLTSMLLQTQSALHNMKNVSVANFSFENLLKMLHSVENQTKRLSKMINDLLSVSVITSGHLELEYEEVDLGKLVNNVIDDFSAKAEREGIEIRFKPEEKIVGFWDKIRIEQAISNFISNAIKYGEHKPIEVFIKKNKQYAELIVQDQGIGINNEQQETIFDLFRRGVSSEKYKGLGVGLYITQKIVHAHGGSIEVKSAPGKGSSFKILLPLTSFRQEK
jgi:signal transduction histidine kinase